MTSEELDKVAKVAKIVRDMKKVISGDDYWIPTRLAPYEAEIPAEDETCIRVTDRETGMTCMFALVSIEHQEITDGS